MICPKCEKGDLRLIREKGHTDLSAKIQVRTKTYRCNNCKNYFLQVETIEADVENDYVKMGKVLSSSDISEMPQHWKKEEMEGI